MIVEPLVTRRERLSAVLPWVAVGVVGAGIRLGLLAYLPLDLSEARLGVSALHRGDGLGDAMLPSSPLLTHLTALSFWLFGASDATIRLVPALAGAALVVVPTLLVPLIGGAAAVAVGALLAVAPLAVDAARRAEPASISGLLVLLAVAAAARLLTDRPRWAPYPLAAALGLGLALEAALIVALLTAALAALFTGALFGRPVLDDAARLWMRARRERDALILAGVLAAVAATGGLVELRGLGYLVGDLWSRVPEALAPSPPSVRNLLVLGAYSGPLLLLALAEGVRGLRTRDPLSGFLALWALLALLSAVFAREQELTPLLVPTLPAAVLGGRALARLAWPPRPMVSAGWVWLALLIALAGAAVAVGADSVGAGRAPSRVALVGFVLLAAGLVAAWRRVAQAGAGSATLSLTALLLLSAWSGGSIVHASFGASPPGAEPQRPDPTAPAFRAIFRELNVIATRSSAIQLEVRTDPSTVGEWYGRAIPRGAGSGPPAPSGIVVQTAEGHPTGAGATRIPWRFRSSLKTDDLHPLGIARWLLTRHGLFEGQQEDILVIRPQGG